MMNGDTLFAIWLCLGAAAGIIDMFWQDGYDTDDFAAMLMVLCGPLSLVYVFGYPAWRKRKNRGKDRWQ